MLIGKVFKEKWEIWEHTVIENKSVMCACFFFTLRFYLGKRTIHEAVTLKCVSVFTLPGEPKLLPEQWILTEQGQENMYFPDKKHSSFLSLTFELFHSGRLKTACALLLFFQHEQNWPEEVRNFLMCLSKRKIF